MVENEFLLVLFTAIAPIVVAIIAAFTIHYAKKSHERTAMMDVFHMINTDEHKNTEDKILEKFKEGKLNY